MPTVRTQLASAMKKPSWVHASSQSEPGFKNEIELEEARAKSALIAAELVVSGDEKMAALWEKVRLAAKGDMPVLLRGEPGVGKEPLAEAIHIMHACGDGGKKYWRINCAGITESLAESELFGHDKGAFTGADKDRKGAFELVENGGTIFLDEVGDMPFALQAKLLRVIENREFIKVGSEKQHELKDVKIVAATNRPLEDLMRKGLFRKDLYSRLTANEIMVPNLEERNVDHRIELIGHFLRMIGAKFEKKIGMTETAFNRIVGDSIDYHDNVRGLRNHLTRAFLKASTGAGKMVDIDLEHIESTIPSYTENSSDGEETSLALNGNEATYFDRALVAGFTDDGGKMNMSIDLSRIERNGQDISNAIFLLLCHGAVNFNGGNQSSAAKMLDITRGTLRNKLRNTSLIVPDQE